VFGHSGEDIEGIKVEYVKIDHDNTGLLDNIAEDVFDEPINKQRFSHYLKQNNHCLIVAVNNGLVVGHIRAVVHMHPDLPSELYIDNLGVTPKFQRQGIATRLVAQIRKFGKQAGCRDVWVATEANNDEASGFYEALDLKKNQIHMYDGRV